MIAKAEVKMKRQKRKAKADPEAVTRILETLPVLSACNDLRALTDLEPQNRVFFQHLGGLQRMVDYMRPQGQNAPYATIVARTLPCVLDAEGRRLFHEYASGADSDGEVRYRYLLALLQSADPDDKENACIAVAAAAQDSPPNRQALFDQGIARELFAVLKEQSMQPIPRQRLQRALVLAMGELANNFDPYKDLLGSHGGVNLLLSFLTPSHDEQLIKETLQLLGRMTQNSALIQQELQRHAPSRSTARSSSPTTCPTTRSCRSRPSRASTYARRCPRASRPSSATRGTTRSGSSCSRRWRAR